MANYDAGSEWIPIEEVEVVELGFEPADDIEAGKRRILSAGKAR